MANVTFPSQPRGARTYKSRRERPCDFCRARKVACRIHIAPPCAFCLAQGVACTFVERPRKRKRPGAAATAFSDLEINLNAVDLNFSAAGSSLQTLPELSVGLVPEPWELPGDFAVTNLLSSISPEVSSNAASSTAADERCDDEQTRPRQVQDQHAVSDSYPLDCLSASELYLTSRFLGDDEILQTSLKYFPFDEAGKYALPYVTYRRMRNEGIGTQDSNSAGSMEKNPVFFTQYQSDVLKTAEPRLETSDLERLQQEINVLFTENQSVRLLKLFFNYVYPYFPILSRSWFYAPGDSIISRIRALPLSLLSCLYATTLPFIIHDELLVTTLGHAVPDRSRLYRVSWLAITQELHAPCLATLQACLLLLQRGPTSSTLPSTPFKDSFLGWTVALAQIFGLARDCSNWISLPVWERRLRTRLWWAVFTMDIWISYGQRRPPIIHSSEHDVPMLQPCAATHADDMNPCRTPPGCEHFYHLIKLSSVVSDLHEAYFSVRATATTSKNLQVSLGLARTFRARLTEWKYVFVVDCPRPASSTVQSLSPCPNQLNANPSLELAYSVAATLVFRALLRTIQHVDEPSLTSDSSPSSRVEDANGVYTAIHTGALASARDSVEFLERIVLVGGTWNAFWHSWSQSNFVIIGSFLVYLLLRNSCSIVDLNHTVCDVATVGGAGSTSVELIDLSSDSAQEALDLVKRWRSTLRIASGSGGWGYTLTNLALLRIEEFMVLLEKIQYKGQ
ncbi:hypothetical protein N7486_005928 [Penicillium sp. IBT 16267x]|nr:hypothetical protein N7486_005928 [Penicillium sp. IBT 16267x]